MLATHLNLYKSEKCGASLVIGHAKDKTSAKTCWVVQVKIFLSNHMALGDCARELKEKTSFKNSFIDFWYGKLKSLTTVLAGRR